MKSYEFIIETQVKKYQSEVLELKKAMTLLNKYCTESLALLPNPIWRGMDDHKESIVFIDPGSGIRKSTNTSNHYTQLIDNSPYFNGWPKRSRSLICSTDINYAEDYVGWSGSLYAIFPFNGVKIGVCPSSDIWDTMINLSEFNFRYTDELGLSDLNDWLHDDLRFPDSYPKMIQYVKSNQFAKLLAKKSPNIRPDQVIPMLQKAMSPQNAGFKLMTVPQFAAAKPKKKEVWIEGKVIAIQKPMWQKFLSAYKKGKK